MAAIVAFTLKTVTPYRLRYLCSTVDIHDGDSISVGVLPNAGGATPDLRTDTMIWHGYPISDLVSTPAANQTLARRLLLADRQVAPADLDFERGNTLLTPRNSWNVFTFFPKWSVDANEGAAAGDPASAGFPVFTLTGPPGILIPGAGPPIPVPAECYLDLYFHHTDDR